MQQVQCARRCQEGTCVSHQAQTLPAVAMQASPRLFCQPHPCRAPCLSWTVTCRKGQCQGLLSRGNVIYFRYLKGRHLSPAFPSWCYSTPCLWCGPLASHHSAVKFFTHHLSLCQFISMDTPVPPKVSSALSFLSGASSELASAKQSYCK